MKTIIIYSSAEEDLLFSIVEGDYSHLNKCFINSGLDYRKEREACDFFMMKKVISKYPCLMICLFLNLKIGTKRQS